MQAVKFPQRRQFQVDGVYFDISHTAIIIGPQGVIFVFIYAITFFVRRWAKRLPSLDAKPFRIRGVNESSNRRKLPWIGGEVQVAEEVQEPGHTHEYQAAEPAYQQNELPPAYELIQVWPSRVSRTSTTRNNWTSVCPPLRSTRSG
jgi:hypothetical protein